MRPATPFRVPADRAVNRFRLPPGRPWPSDPVARPLDLRFGRLLALRRTAAGRNPAGVTFETETAVGAETQGPRPCASATSRLSRATMVQSTDRTSSGA